MRSPKVAVVTPVHGKLPLTLRFLESFRRVDYPSYEIVIVDDGSADGTAEALARDYPHVRVLRGDGGLWWTGGTNKGVRYALRRGFDYVLTINNDTVVSPGFLGHLVETAEAHPRAVVGSRINFLDQPRRVWAVGGYAHWHRGVVLQLSESGADEADTLARRRNPAQAELLTGCGTLVPAECYREVGLYDRLMCPQYHADAEFTLRAGARGWRMLVDLRAVVFNDAGNTCVSKNVLSRRSPWYWRPLVAIHLRYCPRRYLLKSLAKIYAEVLADKVYPARPGETDPPLVRARRRLRGLLRRAG